jgi:hypothetical protein
VRARLLELVKCSSGPLEGVIAAGKSFTRVDGGSFFADGFTPGDEITASGIDGVMYVRGVQDAQLTVDRLPASVAGGMISPVTFSCGLPIGMAWEDVIFSPVDGQPYIAESIRPISSVVRGLGKGGLQAHTVSANFVVNYPATVGARGAELMAGAMLDLFEPGSQLVYGSSSGTVTAAERKPLLLNADFIGVPVLITLVGYTARI